MKKALSIILILCMVCILAMPALAVEAPLEEAPLTEADALLAEAPLLDVEVPQEESGQQPDLARQYFGESVGEWVYCGSLFGGLLPLYPFPARRGQFQLPPHAGGQRALLGCLSGL